jgi:hypothetical protein
MKNLNIMKKSIKKNWILLMTCLMMMSSVYSQTASNNDCIVPCSALKNALKLKVQYDYCYNQLSVTRDSILLLDSINHQKDTIILNKNKEISLLNDNIIQKDKIVTEHSNRADFYKKEVVRQKRLKLLSIGSGILGVVASILFL